MRHGLAFLREAHRNPAPAAMPGCCAGRTARAEVLDATNHCYGLAFVLLAYAHALMAGVDEARAWLDETWDLMERRFWEPAHGLYADEASADWSQLSRLPRPERQHAQPAKRCWPPSRPPASSASWRAPRPSPGTSRGARPPGDGMIWEHYRADWSPDWDYNRDDKPTCSGPGATSPAT
jgi:mannose/cellobiose epimerase-like protein (N-acyl-D-glucosamine 2-epimerase family)